MKNKKEIEISKLFNIVESNSYTVSRSQFIYGLEYLSSQELQENLKEHFGNLINTYSTILDIWQSIHNPNSEEFKLIWTNFEWNLIQSFEKEFYQTNKKIGKLNLDSPKIHQNDDYKNLIFQARELLTKLK